MPRRYGPDGSRLWNGKAPEDFNQADVYRFMAETEAVLQKQELLGGRDDAKKIAQQLAEGRAQAAPCGGHAQQERDKDRSLCPSLAAKIIPKSP